MRSAESLAGRRRARAWRGTGGAPACQRGRPGPILRGACGSSIRPAAMPGRRDRPGGRSPMTEPRHDHRPRTRWRASSGSRETWWDPKGPMRALHRFNPVRLAYIRDAACRRFGRDPTRGPRPLDGLRDPRRRLRRRRPVRAPRPARRPGDRARPGADQHRASRGCTRSGPASRSSTAARPSRRWRRGARRFDVVLAMEVVEHVADVAGLRRGLRQRGEAGRAPRAWRPSTGRCAPSRSPSSAPNTCSAGCRRAPTNGRSSSPRRS